MTDDDSAWADEVLRRVRSSADPKPANAFRVRARLERIIHLDGRVLLEDTPRTSGSALERDPVTQLQPSAVVNARGLLRASLWRVGLGAAFGVATGALGYWWGWHAHAEQARVTPPSLSSAHPAAVEPIRIGASPRATPDAFNEPTATPPAAVTPISGKMAAVPERTQTKVEPQTSRRRPRRPERPTAERVETEHVDAPLATARSGEGSSRELSLREAISQLQRAQLAIRRGQPARALELVSDLERRSPPEMLREELLVTRALALCALGDAAGANVIRHELEATQASAMYRARLDASCAPKSKVE